MPSKFKFLCVIFLIVSTSVCKSSAYSVSRLQRNFRHDLVLPSIIKDFSDKDSELSFKPDESEIVDENGNYLDTRVFYNGSQVWKLPLRETKLFKELSELNTRKEISWWGGDHTFIDMLVRPSSRSLVESLLTKYNVTHEVIIPDVQQAIDRENPVYDEDQELANRKGHRMTWQSYHQLADIHGYLDYLALTYPNLCSVRTIGSTVESRPLKVLRISNGNVSNKAIWIDGGIHAREWISPAVVTGIINNFVEDYESETEPIKNIDWYFLSVANPDGYEYSHRTDRLWRKNRSKSQRCAGTDLNRNFGYRWGGKGNSANTCAETYGGKNAFSEPESQAIRDFFMSSAANFKAYISFHSYGQYILYPWGYDRVVPPDYMDLLRVGNKAAQEIKKVAGASYTVGAAANTLYPAAGGSDDWAKSIGIKYSYTIELRDSGRYGFILPASFIGPSIKEGLAAVRVIAEAVYNSN